jgi:hypothetical protein
MGRYKDYQREPKRGGLNDEGSTENRTAQAIRAIKGQVRHNSRNRSKQS